MKLLQRINSPLRALPKGGAQWGCLLALLLWLTVGVNKAQAQLDPLDTQYLFNMQLVNPAYVGTAENYRIIAMTLNQWVGVDKAPTTNTISFQSPTSKKDMAFGVSVMSDNFAYVNRLTVFVDYSYAVALNNRGKKLRFGLKAGFANYSNDLGSYATLDNTDPYFQGTIEQNFMPNFGVGIFFQDKDYYFGASIPKLLEFDVDADVNKDWNIQSDLRHWTFIGGYIYEIDRDLQFKPSMCVRLVSNMPPSIDLNANFLIKDFLWLGGMYRYDAGFGVMAQWEISPKVSLGYSVDFYTQGIYSNSLGMHEIMLSYDFGKPSRRRFY
ncbi:MAG: type IX secretion system membrane protein PorP/SprF [Mangrovibacterium sp.]